MDSRIEKLKNLDDNKLIDVVKNYRQYGYEIELRTAAIQILESRGVDMEILKLKGDFENKAFNAAESYFNSFNKLSQIAFVFYALILLIQLLIPFISMTSESIQLIFVITFWFSFVAYIVLLIQSFVSQSRYYKIIDKKDSQLNPGFYFTVGMILYVVMFFVFRKQMKAEMNLIR